MSIGRTPSDFEFMGGCLGAVGSVVAVVLAIIAGSIESEYVGGAVVAALFLGLFGGVMLGGVVNIFFGDK